MRVIRKPTGLLPLAVLLVLADAALVRGQDANAPSQASHQEFTPPSPDSIIEEPAVKPEKLIPPPSDSIAFQETKARAEKGDATAQIELATDYDYGFGVPQNYAEAVKWYRKAAEQGNVNGQTGLGASYQQGRGVKQNYKEAVKWYRKAAEQRDAWAQVFLGDCYRKGQGVPQNDVEAAKWYHKAAEQGHAVAQDELGFCYCFGHGVPLDYAKAAKWYRKAAEQGNAVAQGHLAVSYGEGEGVPQDYIEAYKWVNLAAAQGSVHAQEYRRTLVALMTPEMIAEGQRRSSAFVGKKEGGPSNRADGQDSVAMENVPRFTGTGFFVTDDGYLVTAFHVVQDAGRIAVRTTAGTVAATLVKADKANEVALLKVTGKFYALPIASSRGVKLGESVFTIGFPNIELQGFAPKLTKGEISSLAGVQDDPREFQISVAVQPGNSGGPLVNQYGNVVGIVAAQLADMATLQTTGSLPQSVNYAVKSSLLNVLLESLPEISAKLPESNPSKDRKFEDVEREAESAVALVLVY
jgi:hypothetical protein